METAYLIAVEELCSSHDIEYSFIDLLQQYGLIQITHVENSGFITSAQLELLEKYIHMHYDLDINVEGIETISHLLARIMQLQYDITGLKNRLRLYESDAG